MVKVSVIIPTFNRKEMLSKAIDSVLAQTYKDYELIIVDDGSTDNTKAMVDEYISRHKDKIRYFYQENKNASSARNHGVKESKGKYLAFLDSDDIWFADKLEKQVKVLDQKGRGVVHCLKHFVNLVWDEKPFDYPRRPAKSSKDYLTGAGNMSMTVLVSRDVIEEAGMFDEEIERSEDWDLWLRVAEISEIAFIDEALMKGFKHGDNKQFSDIEQRARCHLKILGKVLNSRHPLIDKRHWRKRLYFAYYELGKITFEKKRYKESRAWLLKALGHSPLVTSRLLRPKHKWREKLNILYQPYKYLFQSIQNKS